MYIHMYTNLAACARGLSHSHPRGWMDRPKMVARGGWDPAFRGMDVVVCYRPRDKIVEVPRGTVHEACFWKGIIARSNKKLIGPCVVLSIRFKSSLFEMDSDLGRLRVVGETTF